MQEKEPTGYLIINKPKDLTSFQCINKIKKIINKKIKIGHAGTLDPFATGLLIIAIGREYTKSISSLMDEDKKYTVKAKLGTLTDTLDLTGETLIDNEKIPTKEELEKAINKIGNEYLQIPPIYSALKHKGQPLYKLAREKALKEEDIEKIAKSKSRKVKIYSLKITKYNKPYFHLEAHVSKGTYIRSLVNDIAKLTNSFATTYELERTAIGKTKLSQAVELEQIKTLDDIYLRTSDKL